MSKWETTALNTFAQLKNGYAFSSNTYCNNGTYNIITIKNVTGDKYISLQDCDQINTVPQQVLPYHLLKEEDLLISMTGNVGRVSLNIGTNNLLNQRVGLLQFKDGKADKGFIFQILSSFRFLEAMKIVGQGGAQQNIGKKDIELYPIFYPTNIAEQRKIAEVLSTVDEAIEKTTAIIEKYENMKIGLMQDLLGKGNKYTVKRCFTLRARIGWQGLRSDEFIREGAFLVTGTDFKNNKIDWDNCYRVAEWRYKQDLGIQIRNDDLLITKDGTIGKTAFVDRCPEKATLNSGIFVVRPKKNEVITKYLFYILNSHSFELFMKNVLTGSTIKHLNQEHFYKFSFYAPSVEEQKDIVEQLTQIEDVVSNERNYLTKLLNIKKGLMHDLLTNKVPVEKLLQEEAI